MKVSVAAGSSASQKETKRTPVSWAADSEMVRSRTSSSSALEMRWFTVASARTRSAWTRSAWYSRALRMATPAWADSSRSASCSSASGSPSGRT